MTDDQYLAIKDRAYDQFIKVPNVNAVGIGARRTNGQPTGEIAIRVYVTIKKPLDEVPINERIPASFEGIPTDVDKLAPTTLPPTTVPGVEFPEALPDITDYQPRRGGGSLSTQSQGIGIGTLGCFLRDKNDGSGIYALTNFHVIALKNKLSRSALVAHPSTTGFLFDAGNAIGIVTEGGEIHLRDAALVRMQQGESWIPFVQQIGYLRGSRDVTIAEIATGTFEVRKRGVATLLTGGVIDSIGDVVIEKTRRRNVLFVRPNLIQGQTNTRVRFSAKGDSGSVVVNHANEVVGLHFAEQNLIQNDPNPSPTDGFGFAFRIGTVLRRFKDVETLDLEVAVAKNADAVLDTDPREKQEVPFPAGVPDLPLPERVARGDHRYYRPLIGSAQILVTPMLGDANGTTLGCIVTETANANVAYVLTSFSSVSANGTVTPTSDTDAGQPDNDDCCSGSCSNTVGAFAKAAPSPKPRAALVKLKDDQKWLAEIMRLGLVAGSVDADITHNDITTFGPINVWKAGAATRVTSGVIVRVPDSPTPLPAGVPDDAMLIRPHPDPSKPDTAEVHFSQFGDRGSVIVNRANQVVGVLFGEVPLDEANGRRVVHGLATPINVVLNGLKAQPGIEVEVARAADVNVVNATNLRTALPQGLSAAPVPLTDAMTQSPAGRAVVAVWHTHQHEVRELIAHNRRFATIWHRNEGPAIAQAFVRAFHSPSTVIPDTVNGRPIGASIDRFCAMLSQFGSEALKADVTRLHPWLPRIGGRSLEDILAGVDVAKLSEAFPEFSVNHG